jgi:hypothetical protein
MICCLKTGVFRPRKILFYHLNIDDVSRMLVDIAALTLNLVPVGHLHPRRHAVNQGNGMLMKKQKLLKKRKNLNKIKS